MNFIFYGYWKNKESETEKNFRPEWNYKIIAVICQLEIFSILIPDIDDQW